MYHVINSKENMELHVFRHADICDFVLKDTHVLEVCNYYTGSLTGCLYSQGPPHLLYEKH